MSTRRGILTAMAGVVSALFGEAHTSLARPSGYINPITTDALRKDSDAWPDEGIAVWYLRDGIRWNVLEIEMQETTRDQFPDMAARITATQRQCRASIAELEAAIPALLQSWRGRR